MRTLALDFGPARTGVAVSDETGTIARPLAVVADAESAAGLETVAALVAEHEAGEVVVGVPVSLDARERDQARRARVFARRLGEILTVPVATYDERFTTKVARSRGGAGPLDARAAGRGRRSSWPSSSSCCSCRSGSTSSWCGPTSPRAHPGSRSG